MRVCNALRYERAVEAVGRTNPKPPLLSTMAAMKGKQSQPGQARRHNAIGVTAGTGGGAGHTRGMLQRDQEGQAPRAQEGAEYSSNQ